MYWIKIPYLHVKSDNFAYKAKIASFDIDGTIITTKSNKKFPVNKNDWKFLYDITILEKLKELHNNNYCIIFISNQGGIKSETQTNDWIEKMQNIAAEIQKYENINIPISIYAATSDYLYRKPLPKLWNIILSDLTSNNISIDKLSFYCGDAAGRKNDHNDTDYKFAVNCNLEFKTPEMLFLNQETSKTDKLNITYPDLSLIPLNQQLNSQYLFRSIIENKKELILMIGFPGSGKTYYAKTFIEPTGYIYISQDVLKTKAKCIKEFKNNLKLNKNIVIDNLNYSKIIRQEYILIAKENNYEIRCIVLNTSKELSKHNMMCRFHTSNGIISRIPELVYNNYHKKYEIPEMNENIHKIEFIDYSKIANIKSKNYYEYYY